MRRKRRSFIASPSSTIPSCFPVNIKSSPLSSSRNFAIILFILLIFAGGCSAFNLDIHNPVVKFGQPGTYFGYAVAQHLRGGEPLLLIGAPKGESGQFGTKQAGALLACPVNNVRFNNSVSRTRENEFLFKWCDLTRPEYPPGTDVDPYTKDPTQLSDQVFDKNRQWLGATVSSGGQAKSSVLVCAPTLLFSARAYVDGQCYVLNNKLENEVSIRGCHGNKEFPKAEGYSQYGVCEMGFSGVMDEKYKVLALGYPGALNWLGGVYGKDWGGGTVVPQWGHQMYSTPLTEYPKRGADEFIPRLSYFGYSTAVGRFGFPHEKLAPKEEQVITIAAGATRYDNLTNAGGVFFMEFHNNANDLSENLLLDEQKMRLRGDGFLGAGFGYSLATADLDGNGYEDLLVGAPFFYNGSMAEPHTGAVYVYFATGKGRYPIFEDPIRLLGTVESQFGAAIARLGDINHDGFEDFAVGAPYAESGGSVHIFLGSPRDKFDREAAQIINGTHIQNVVERNKPLETFGWSLSGGTDLDANGYPDLLVGAFRSDAAILLRSRPIVNVQAGVQEGDLKPIDKDTQQCNQGGACFSFHTVLALRDFERIKSIVSFSDHSLLCRLEITKSKGANAPRAHFVPTSAGRKSDYLKEWRCGRNLDRTNQFDKHDFVIPASNRDWLNPLQFEFTVHLPDQSAGAPAGEAGAPLPDINRFPVLNAKGAKHVFQIDFNKKCGADNKCESDLLVKCSLQNIQKEPDTGIYVKHAGQDEYIDVSLAVQNIAEHAYDSNLYVTYDEKELMEPVLKQTEGTQYSTVTMMRQRQGFVEISLGNPLVERAYVQMNLQFKLIAGRSAGLSKPLEFVAMANTSSVDIDLLNNECLLKVKVIKQANLELIGGIPDQDIKYYGGEIVGETLMEFEEDVGPMVTHEYTITNDGKWGVQNVTVHIDWPYEVQSPWPHGKWALYVIEMPAIITYDEAGKMREVRHCSTDFAEERINPLNLKVNTRYSIVRPGGGAAIGRFRRNVGAEAEPIRSPSTQLSKEKHRRYSRDLRVAPENVKDENGEEVTRVVIDCKRGTAKCFRLHCWFDFIAAKGKPPVIRIRSRLWNSTFIEDYPDVDYVLIRSSAQLEIDPRQGIEQTNLDDDTAVAITRAQPDVPQIADVGEIPIWVIVVAVVAGIFLLFLIVVACWWCGFFKRKRVPKQPRMQAQFQHSEEQQMLAAYYEG